MLKSNPVAGGATGRREPDAPAGPVSDVGAAADGSFRRVGVVQLAIGLATKSAWPHRCSASCPTRRTRRIIGTIVTPAEQSPSSAQLAASLVIAFILERRFGVTSGSATESTCADLPIMPESRLAPCEERSRL